MPKVSNLKTLQNWFAESRWASVLRTFVAIVITQASLEFSRIGHFDFSNWQSWLIVAIAAVVPMFARVANPADELN